MPGPFVDVADDVGQVLESLVAHTEVGDASKAARLRY